LVGETERQLSLNSMFCDTLSVGKIKVILTRHRSSQNIHYKPLPRRLGA
jgi:hypothetical protein